MSNAAERVVDVFFALGDETRLSVVRKLSRGTSLSATGIAGDARISRQAIAKHLRVLEGAGLVTHEKRGREVLYALDSRRLSEARDYMDAISAEWDRALERLRHFVEDPRKPRTRK